MMWWLSPVGLVVSMAVSHAAWGAPEFPLRTSCYLEPWVRGVLLPAPHLTTLAPWYLYSILGLLHKVLRTRVPLGNSAGQDGARFFAVRLAPQSQWETPVTIQAIWPASPKSSSQVGILNF